MTSPRRLLFGFIAGFLGTLVFHQPVLAILNGIGFAPFGAFNMSATQPLGVPVMFSLAFWGGIWGILFALIHGKFPRGSNYWVAAFLFGGIFPTLVALLIVVPLKGGPLGAGWNPYVWATAFIINGVWGIGTGVFLRLFSGRSRMATS